MNQAQIRKKFRDLDSSDDAKSVTSTELAKWLADNSERLTPSDMAFLISVGRTLYSVEAEKRWRDAW